MSAADTVESMSSSERGAITPDAAKPNGLGSEDEDHARDETNEDSCEDEHYTAEDDEDAEPNDRLGSEDEDHTRDETNEDSCEDEHYTTEDDEDAEQCTREELEEYVTQCEARIEQLQEDVLQLRKVIADRDEKIRAMTQQSATQAKQMSDGLVAKENTINTQKQQLVALTKKADADKVAMETTNKRNKQLDSHIAVQETLFRAGLQKMASWLQLFPPYTPFQSSSFTDKRGGFTKEVERIREELQGVYKCVIHVVYAYLHNGQYVRERQEGDIVAVGFFGSNNTVTSQRAERYPQQYNSCAMTTMNHQHNKTSAVEFDGTGSFGTFFAPLHFDRSAYKWLDMKEEWTDFVKYNPYGRTFVRILARRGANGGTEFHITEYELVSGRELAMKRFWKDFGLWKGFFPQGAKNTLH